MAQLLGFELGFWDYATFVTAALLALSAVAFVVWLAGLPGRIALARKHPEAEAVKLLGWAGIAPTIYPWVQALIWAFKPTDVVDIRRFPREEAKAIEEQIAHLSDKAPPPPTRVNAARNGAQPTFPDATTSDTTSDETKR